MNLLVEFSRHKAASSTKTVKYEDPVVALHNSANVRGSFT